MNKKTSKIYCFGGNYWYVVEEDDEKLVLVDTDCKIGDEELKTPWSDQKNDLSEQENGQCILDYCNSLADKYFACFKDAIIPREVTAGTGKIENAYIWPMSKDEFKKIRVESGRIMMEVLDSVWTRTLSKDSKDNCHAWRVNSSNGNFSDSCGVNDVCHVAPALCLKKSEIYFTAEGKIELDAKDSIKADPCSPFSKKAVFKRTVKNLKKALS